MIPQVLIQVGTGSSRVVGFDIFRNPFNIGFGVIVSGTVNYTVQHTFDDIEAPGYVAASGNWFNNDNSALVGATTSQDGNYYFPVRASRIVINSGNGTVTLTYIQAGLMGG